MATSETFRKKQPFKKIKYAFDKESEIAKPLEIEVFGYDHKKSADKLYKVLKDSGFLMSNPLYSIKIETMDFHKPIE